MKFEIDADEFGTVCCVTAIVLCLVVISTVVFHRYQQLHREAVLRLGNVQQVTEAP
jgi:hypothetical protein